MNKPTIAAAFIVKNEHGWIGPALDSVRSIVDELVVVDTGSDDDTAAEARAHGASVYAFPWQDDFAAARNAAIEKVQSDWILMMDADEQFVAEDKEILHHVVEQPTADAYNIRIVSLAERPENINEARVMRLFRNDPRIRYEGRVHEQLVPALNKAHLAFTTADLRLLHYGYLPQMVQQRHKVQRNIALLQKMMAERPQESYWPWQLAQTYLQSGKNLSEALVLAQKVLQMPAPSSDMRPVFLMTLARIYMARGQWLSARTALEEDAKEFPTYTDFRYYWG
ncbi:MAG: glycosyltransferase family 2 protein, partial [Firmicutes bacterium]|nr:glycosyltransferase family 2 protein [Bacillota bacterium]